MNVHADHSPASVIQGRLMRLGEHHEVAIYLRDGVAWVAEFKDGRGELVDAGSWFRFQAGGLRYSHGLRAAALESAIPLSGELVSRIECLHQDRHSHGPGNANPAVAIFDSLKRHLEHWTSRIRALASKRMHEPN